MSTSINKTPRQFLSTNVQGKGKGGGLQQSQGDFKPAYASMDVWSKDSGTVSMNVSVAGLTGEGEAANSFTYHDLARFPLEAQPTHPGFEEHLKLQVQAGTLPRYELDLAIGRAEKTRHQVESGQRPSSDLLGGVTRAERMQKEVEAGLRPASDLEGPEGKAKAMEQEVQNGLKPLSSLWSAYYSKQPEFQTPW